MHSSTQKYRILPQMVTQGTHQFIHLLGDTVHLPLRWFRSKALGTKHKCILSANASSGTSLLVLVSRLKPPTAPCSDAPPRDPLRPDAQASGPRDLAPLLGPVSQPRDPARRRRR